MSSTARVATVRLGTLVGFEEDGTDDGLLLGALEFFSPKMFVGNAVGWPEGRLDGTDEGTTEGIAEGTLDGTDVGILVGVNVGKDEGTPLGTDVGML